MDPKLVHINTLYALDKEHLKKLLTIRIYVLFI